MFHALVFFVHFVFLSVLCFLEDGRIERLREDGTEAGTIEGGREVENRTKKTSRDNKKMEGRDNRREMRMEKMGSGRENSVREN